MQFAELIAKSNYSFLEGASFPEEMVSQAKSLGYYALGMVDRSGVYGAPRAHVAAKKAGLPLVLGSELRISEKQKIYLLVKNRNGYGNLCEILTDCHSKLEEKSRGIEEPVVASLEILCKKSDDLFLFFPAFQLDPKTIDPLREVFKDRLYLVASRFLDGNHRGSLKEAEVISEKLNLPCIASNQPLFHTPKRKALQDVVTGIRYTVPLTSAGYKLQPNRERYLKPMEAMAKLYQKHPEWLENTVKIAEQCNFSLDEIRYQYPSEWLPVGETPDSYLRKLVALGCKERFPNGVNVPTQKQIQHELSLIEELKYSDYFLTIWDIVQFARQQKILCQGRGSAANSTVCFVLGITAIDPVRSNLLFERFISRERQEPPDIDIDFEHERREEVIQYIYERYGRNRAAITAEVICFRKRSALREVAKVFEISLEDVEKILVLTNRTPMAEIDFKIYQETVPQVPIRKLRQFLGAVQSIKGFPRHIGTHVGGFVLCQDLLTRNVPVENAAMEKRTIIQWDKNDLDNLGFVKVDILGLGILTCIRKCLKLLKDHYGRELELATIPAEDPEVYKALAQADTVGVFQIESRAQMNMLPRLLPRNFYDLVVEISLVRPGPIQGEMVHPYLRRRMGKEPIEYAHPDFVPILERTFGVPLFQEQIMKMAMTVGGFTPGEADELRRAMGSWRRNGKDRLNSIGQKFIAGLRKRGVEEKYTQQIFSQIQGFAEYGFPESHAASFAILAYATAWLKVHYPDLFLIALLNSQPMGFYQSHVLIHDGVRHEVQTLGVDIQYSHWDNRWDSHHIVRMGYREIKGFPKKVGLAIEAAQKAGPFQSFFDFTERIKKTIAPGVLTKRDLFLLAGANAFQSLGLKRRNALWEIQGLQLQDSPYFTPQDLPIQLPREKVWEGISLDYGAQGVTINTHPMAYLRPQLAKRRIENSMSVRKRQNNQRVQVSGIVICRQMPGTASGVLFVSLEDEFGFINLVVWRKIYDQFRIPLTQASFLLCTGKVQKAEETDVTHIIVENAESLLDPNDFTSAISHDFH